MTFFVVEKKEVRGRAFTIVQTVSRLFTLSLKLNSTHIRVHQLHAARVREGRSLLVNRPVTYI